MMEVWYMNYIITSESQYLRLRAGQLRNRDWTPVRKKEGFLLQSVLMGSETPSSLSLSGYKGLFPCG